MAGKGKQLLKKVIQSKIAKKIQNKYKNIVADKNFEYGGKRGKAAYDAWGKDFGKAIDKHGLDLKVQTKLMKDAAKGQGKPKKINKRGGGKVYKYKKGTGNKTIKGRMSGNDVVAGCYD